MTVKLAIPANVLMLVPPTDPVLYAPANPVPPEAFDELAPIAKQMLATCRVRRGIGLAAPQVGLPYRMFVMVIPGGRDYVCINPRIHDRTRATETQLEGCLTLPGNQYQVERSVRILAEWWDVRGQQCRSDMSGLLARVFQHEYDHLSGKVIWPSLYDHGGNEQNVRGDLAPE